MVRPGCSRPEASPSAIIRDAARSFTEPPGFCHSAFAYSSTPGVSRSKCCRRTSGVRPIRSTTDAAARSVREGDVEDMKYATGAVRDYINGLDAVKTAGDPDAVQGR